MWYIALRQATKPRDQWTVSLDQHLLNFADYSDHILSGIPSETVVPARHNILQTSIVWMKPQHDAGKILFSGPTTDRKYGVYVIRADSKDEAAKIAASDPYTAAGLGHK